MRINLAFLSKLFLLVLFSSFLVYLWYYGNEGRRVGDVPKVQTYAKHFSGEARGLSIVSKAHRSQHEAVLKFCNSHEEARNVDMTIAYKHLMYDDKYKIIYCFVPKAGCTSLKPVFEYLHGLIQANQTFDRHDIHGKNTHKTLLYRLPKSERERRLNTYYKFMILRDPLERMMSGYKDKLEVPLSSDKRLKDHNKADVAHFLSPDNHMKVLKEVVSNKEVVQYVPFMDYMTYLSQEKFLNLDQHFMPMFHLCNPCAVNYTFYGNFHSMTDDISQVLHEIGAPQWLYHARSEHSTLSMKEMMNLYFGQVPPGERTKLKEEFTKRTGFSFKAAPDEDIPRRTIQTVLNRFKTEFDFYYSLFPSSDRQYANLHY